MKSNIIGFIGFVAMAFGAIYFFGALSSSVVINIPSAAAEASIRTGNICAGGFLMIFGAITIRTAFQKP